MLGYGRVKGPKFGLDEAGRALGVAAVHAVQYQAVQVSVQFGSGAEALDRRDSANVAFVSAEPGSGQQQSQREMTWAARCTAVCDIRRAALAAERQQPVGASIAALQSQETAGQDAALKQRLELVLDEPGQLGAGAGIGVGDEGGCVMLHQTVQRGRLGAVAFVVCRAPSGVRWGCCAVARTMSSRWSKPARSQAARHAPVGLMAARRRAPSAAATYG